jgi:hypothetical protein
MEVGRVAFLASIRAYLGARYTLDLPGSPRDRGCSYALSWVDPVRRKLGAKHYGLTGEHINWRWGMRPRIAVLVLTCVPLTTATVFGGNETGNAWKLPALKLAVAYRQLEDGKLSDRVFVGQLNCSGDSCELLTAVLNWCVRLPETGKGFLIGLTRDATDDGSLEIVQVSDSKDGPRVLVLKKHLGTAEITYRFGFSSLDPTRLTSFDGAAVQPWHKRVKTWTLVPSKGRFVRWSPDCPIVLEGVP